MKGEFHLIISGIGHDSRQHLYHKEFYQDTAADRLRNGWIPDQITNAVVNDSSNEITNVLFLLRKNTYYICIIKRSGKGYDLEAYKLNENFSRIAGKCSISTLPGWLTKSSPDLKFNAEGEVITVQSLATGRNQGIAHITSRGEMKFKPQ